MDNICLLNILRNDSTNEGNHVGETEGNPKEKMQVGKQGLLCMKLASCLIALLCFNGATAESKRPL